MAKNIIKEKINEALKLLKEREAEVLKMRFGIEDGNEHTLREIAKQFGVTPSRIGQIEAKALRRLKHPTRRRELKKIYDKLGPKEIYNNLNPATKLLFCIFGFWDFEKLIEIVKKTIKEFPEIHHKLEGLKEFKSMLNKEILDLEKKLKELYDE